MRVLCLAIALAGALGAQHTTADQQVNLGIEAPRSARYAAAAGHSQPPSTRSRVRRRPYLATSYMMQYVPGSQSAENRRLAQRALDEFQQV